MTMRTEITGLAELAKALRDLPQSVQAKALRNAVSAGAEVIRAEAARRAPVYAGKVGKGHPAPGTLKASIYKASMPDESTATREVWKVDVRRRAYYAHMVERGTVKMSPRPFMRPAWDSKKDEALDVIRTRIAQAVRAAMKAA